MSDHLKVIRRRGLSLEEVANYQELINAWRLEGSVGRTAMCLIECQSSEGDIIMIEIKTSNQENGETVVYAVVMGEAITLGSSPCDESWRAKAFTEGAEALAKALGEKQPSPEKVAQMAQEAARAAGVDESIIRQGGVAVGPFGAMNIPGDFIEGEEYDDCHPVYE